MSQPDLFRGLTRRDYMRQSAAAAMAALTCGAPRLLAQNDDKPKATADSIILLWMAGGMAQTETLIRRRIRRISRVSKASGS